MTATTNAIVTEMRDGELMPVLLKAGATVLEGTLAIVNADGYAVDSANAAGAGLICLGVWDNSAHNGGLDGDAVAMVRRNKQFLMANSATDPITQDNLGDSVYVADNQTLSKTDGTGTRSIAGRFMGFDTQFDQHVWVEI